MERKKEYSSNKFEKNLTEIKKTLLAEKPLSGSQKSWLQRQRMIYQNHDHVGYKMSQQRIQQLDALNPLLGKDWKVTEKLVKVEQKLQLLLDRLKANEELLPDQKKWLKTQCVIQRRSDHPKDNNKKKLLDEFTPYLGYNWRERSFNKNELILDQHYQSIVSSIENKEKIKAEDDNWLRSQEHRYNAQHHNRISKYELNKLNQLKELLQLDWRIAPLKDASQIEENPRIRKKMENWFVTFSPYLNFSRIERDYGMPKGKLQKFIKYNAKLEYKWVLALKDFRKSLIRES